MLPNLKGIEMSKTNGTTKVATFQGWGFVQPDGCVECADCAPTSTMDYACTSAGNVLWTNTFTNVLVGERVILRKSAQKWVMTGLA
jgi:hypothetical protein